MGCWENDLRRVMKEGECCPEMNVEARREGAELLLDSPDSSGEIGEAKYYQISGMTFKEFLISYGTFYS